MELTLTAEWTPATGYSSGETLTIAGLRGWVSEDAEDAECIEWNVSLEENEWMMTSAGRCESVDEAKGLVELAIQEYHQQNMR